MHPLKQHFEDPLYDQDRYKLSKEQLRADIPTLMGVYDAVKAGLEKARLDKRIGSSLQSSVVVAADSRTAEQLSRYETELATMFVVSSVEVRDEHGLEALGREWQYTEDFQVAVPGEATGGKVFVLPPGQHKCGRCWRYLAEEEDGLCKRCDDVVATL